MSWWDDIIELRARQLSIEAGAISGRAITATLRVSPDGDGTDGLTWPTAYQTPQAAFDAASVDPEDCTLILIGATETFYDIDMAGDPTWAANMDITGTHRTWAAIRNNNVGATSVLNFTGKVSIQDMTIFTVGTVNGISFTGNGWRIRKCDFNSMGLTGAATSIHIDGSGGLTRGGIMEDVQILGHITHTTAIHNEESTTNEYQRVHVHGCLVGILIDGANSAQNHWEHFDIGDCALGIDIDAGDEQHFLDLDLHHNIRNVDDSVRNHEWIEIHGHFPIHILPAAILAPISIPTAVGADTWGGDTEIVAADVIDNPFRIVGSHMEPSAAGIYRIRLSATAGVGIPPYFDELQTTVARREGTAAPSGTEFIHNAGTRISGSAKSDTGNDTVETWIEIQEI